MTVQISLFLFKIMKSLNAHVFGLFYSKIYQLIKPQGYKLKIFTTLHTHISSFSLAVIKEITGVVQIFSIIFLFSSSFKLILIKKIKHWETFFFI